MQTSKATRRYAAERQIAMLDRALEKNAASVEIRLVRLTIAVDASLWDEAKVQTEWRDLLFKHVNSIKVWRAWLRYCRANYRAFTVTSMVGAKASQCVVECTPIAVFNLRQLYRQITICAQRQVGNA